MRKAGFQLPTVDEIQKKQAAISKAVHYNIKDTDIDHVSNFYQFSVNLKSFSSVSWLICDCLTCVFR